MDQLTLGFITIIILFMVIKLLVERYLYKSSVYEVLYSGFTEYRMRRKSIEGMSESFTLKEGFGPHRILYHVQGKGMNDRRAYVTLFLPSGCYVIVVRKDGKISGTEVKTFIQENLLDPLKDTVFHSLSLKPKVILLQTGPGAEKSTTGEEPKGRALRKKDLLRKLKDLHASSDAHLTKAEIDGIYYSLAQESIDAEKPSEAALN